MDKGFNKNTGLTNDWAHTHTKHATGTVIGDVRQMGVRVELDGLVTRIVTRHVTLSTIDAHLIINDCHYLLLVVQLVVRADVFQGFSSHILVENV